MLGGAQGMRVSRLITGLWQVADMERSGEASANTLGCGAPLQWGVPLYCMCV